MHHARIDFIANRSASRRNLFRNRNCCRQLQPQHWQGPGIHQITYSYTNSDGCSNFAETNIFVSECLGVYDGEYNVFSVYPNPAADYVVIDRENPSDFNDLNIYDGNGKIVYSSNVKEFPLTIDVSLWVNGTYFMQFSNGDKKALMQRIVIQ